MVARHGSGSLHRYMQCKPSVERRWAALSAPSERSICRSYEWLSLRDFFSYWPCMPILVVYQARSAVCWVCPIARLMRLCAGLWRVDDHVGTVLRSRRPLLRVSLARGIRVLCSDFLRQPHVPLVEPERVMRPVERVCPSGQWYSYHLLRRSEVCMTTPYGSRYAQPEMS